MTRIVDASVAVKWLVSEPESVHAVDLLGEVLHAPDLIHAEVANVLWKKLRRKEIPHAVPTMAVEWLMAVALEIHPCRDLMPHAMQLSQRLSYPACDCFYLALAVLQDSPLITADRRLHARCQQADALSMGVQVQMLGQSHANPARH